MELILGSGAIALPCPATYLRSPVYKQAIYSIDLATYPKAGVEVWEVTNVLPDLWGRRPDEIRRVLPKYWPTIRPADGIG